MIIPNEYQQKVLREVYVPSRKAEKILGVHANTLRKWADDGKINYIRTDSGQRRYDVDSYLGSSKSQSVVCYCRVSSYKQRDDLERQVEFMRGRFPDAEVIKDVGSGLNYKRKGLKSILERAMSGDKLKVVVAHRDRLCRFGFDLISWIVERSGGEVLVLDQRSLSPEQELTSDLLSILHVFSCRMHGLRNYKNEVREALSNQGAKADIEAVVRD